MRLVLEITDGYARLLDLLAPAFRKRIDPLLEEDPQCFSDPLFPHILIFHWYLSKKLEAAWRWFKNVERTWSWETFFDDFRIYNKTLSQFLSIALIAWWMYLSKHGFLSFLLLNSNKKRFFPLRRLSDSLGALLHKLISEISRMGKILWHFGKQSQTALLIITRNRRFVINISFEILRQTELLLLFIPSNRSPHDLNPFIPPHTRPFAFDHAV